MNSSSLPSTEKKQTETNSNAQVEKIDWDRLSNLRVSKKIGEALSNLEIKEIHVLPTNRRSDSRKRCLGYGSKKIALEVEHSFVLHESNPLVDSILKNHDAGTQLKDFWWGLIETAVERNEPVIGEDPFGLVHVVVSLWADKDLIGVLRVGGFVSGKPDDLGINKICDRVMRAGVKHDQIEKTVKRLSFFSSEKIAVITNLLLMLSQEIGAYLQESLKSTETSDESNKANHQGLVTKNAMIIDIIRQIKLISASPSSVIIYGESGTGKELIAKMIHANSNRNDKPFITINCAALTETILEAELFGYKRGAFTGAMADKKGLFEVADTGTVFLDEVGEMSLSLQVKILRLIQEGTFMRVGDTQSRKVNVRIISATHRDLRSMIELGKFREDLYYRLAVVELTLPPLRDRTGDIPLLVSHFVKYFQEKTGKSGITLASDTMKQFQEYYWPGNVREIRNEIERLVALKASNSMIKPKDLSKKFFYETYPDGLGAGEDEEEGFIKKMVDDFERNLLTKYLKKHRWNKTKVARLCGITRQGLNKKITKYRLDRRRV